jgi:Pentapeptide repeats (8 copies)
MTTPPREPRIHWWSRPSPWLWGFVLVLLVAAVTLSQVPRIAGLRPALAKPSVVSTAGPALSGVDYTQAMVGNVSFAGANLRGARLEHLDLRGQGFQRANASGAVFAGSLLNGANLSHADLRGADLRDTCLRGAILSGAKLAGADFTGADVTGATVRAGATARAIGWGSIPGPACRRT